MTNPACMPAQRAAKKPDQVAGYSIAFIENLGQWDTPARFVARFRDYTVLVEPDAITIHGTQSTPEGRRTSSVRLAFEGSLKMPRLEGSEPQTAVNHYFIGTSELKWRTHIPKYSAVVAHELYPDVDLTLRQSGHLLECNFTAIRQGALEQISVKVEGSLNTIIDSSDALAVQTGFGDLRLQLQDRADAITEDEVAGESARFRSQTNTPFAFYIPESQSSIALVVAPGLEWSTLLDGDSSAAIISDVLVLPSGSILLAGQTSSPDFPVTPGVYQETWAGGTGTMPTDAFVSCLDSSGSELLFSTFLGGASSEGEVHIDLDLHGDILIAGRAGPGAFPITKGVFDETWHAFDAFAAKLCGSGSELKWGTYLGGEGAPSITTLHDLVVDPSGDVFLVGATGAADFPVTVSAYDTTFNDMTPLPVDGFVSRLSADGTSLVASTFIGGMDGTVVTEVSLTSQGWVTVAGGTGASDFPVTPGAYDTVFEGSDGFIAQFDPMLTTLRFASFVGGPGTGVVRGMDLDDSNCITVAGHVNASGLYTTPGAFDSTFNGGIDGFVARFDATGSHLIYSTYFGGNGLDLIRDVAVDSAGVATVVGETNGSFFPMTPGAYQTIKPSSSLVSDVFISRFAPDGQLFYSTYLGGSSFDGGGNSPELMSVALDPVGSAIVGHRTQSPDFPTTEGAYDTTYSGIGGDGFLAKLSMLPTGVGRFGGSSPGCQGPLAISAMGMPRVGPTRMPLTCNRAPPLTSGLLAVGLPTFDLPVDALGTLGWVDFALPFLLLPVSSNRAGYCQVTLHIPNSPDLVGQQFATQFFWPESCGIEGWVASNALAITVQP